MDILECGSEGYGCGFFCISHALFGSIDAGALLKVLSCYAMLAHSRCIYKRLYVEFGGHMPLEEDTDAALPDEFVDDLMNEIDPYGVNWNGQGGCGPVALMATAEALGIVAATSTNMPDMIGEWQVYKSTNVKGSPQIIHRWHNGHSRMAGHWQLGRVFSFGVTLKQGAVCRS